MTARPTPEPAGIVVPVPSPETLQIQAALIYDLQVELLKLFCRLDRAAWDAAMLREDAEESRTLLAEAQRWLGASARETAADGQDVARIQAVADAQLERRARGRRAA